MKLTLGIAFWVAVVAAVILLGGCSQQQAPGAAPAATETVVTDQPHDDDGYSIWLDSDDEDKPDCDSEDKATRETPDCGFLHQGRFYWWSWVLAGRTSAPRGWTPGREIAAVKSPPTTRATSRPAATTTRPTVSTTTQSVTGPAVTRPTTRPAPRPASTTRRR